MSAALKQRSCCAVAAAEVANDFTVFVVNPFAEFRPGQVSS
jgi:hypothetical protein